MNKSVTKQYENNICSYSNEVKSVKVRFDCGSECGFEIQVETLCYIN
jgi:hypothetical protein